MYVYVVFEILGLVNWHGAMSTDAYAADKMYVHQGNMCVSGQAYLRLVQGSHITDRTGSDIHETTGKHDFILLPTAGCTCGAAQHYGAAMMMCDCVMCLFGKTACTAVLCSGV